MAANFVIENKFLTWKYDIKNFEDKMLYLEKIYVCFLFRKCKNNQFGKCRFSYKIKHLLMYNLFRFLKKLF